MGLLIALLGNIYSQEINTDSITIIQKDSLSLSDFHSDSIRHSSDLQLDPDYSAENTLSRTDPKTKNLVMPKFDFDPFPPKLIYFQDEYILISPFNASYMDQYQGGWMSGVNSRMTFSDNFWVNANIFTTNSMMFYLMRDQYKNASFSLEMKWQVHERVRLVGFGEISLRQGLNPAFNPMINGGNHFGGGIEFKVTKNIGIGFGVTNSYYNKSWTLRPYAAPVAW